MVWGIGISALISGCLILFIRHYADVLHLVDEPNHRSAHSHPVPRGAGIAFTLGAIAAICSGDHRLIFQHIYTLLAILSILTIGILDDRHEAAPRTKFIVLLLATFLIWHEGLRIDDVGRYFGIDIHFAWFAFPFTYFAVAGFSNAMNLIDGLDGLAGAVAFLILSFFLLLGYQHHDNFLINISLYFMVGIVVFLFFNWHPATIFMGDSGSLTLGLVISVLAIHALRYIPSVSVLYLGAFPIIDTLVAMFRRKLQGYSVTQPDKCHIHHLLLYITGSVHKTVLIIVGIQLLFLLIALALPKKMDQSVPLVIFFMILAMAYKTILYLIDKYKIECYAKQDKETRGIG